MPIPLTFGGDAALAPSESTAQSILIRLNWRFPEGSPAVTVDASVFLLNADGVVRNDRDWVCYYQPNDLNGAVFRQPPGSPDQNCFQVALSFIPRDVQRLLLCLTLETTAATSTFNAIASIQVVVSDPATNAILIDHHSSSEIGTENGLMVAELYRDGNGWAFRSVDRSFAGRLATLAAHFGVRMAAEELPPAQVAGPNQDCACRIMALSDAGMTDCKLLERFQDKKEVLSSDHLIVALLNEKVLNKIQVVLMREHGCPMTTAEIQNTIKRELLR